MAITTFKVIQGHHNSLPDTTLLCASKTFPTSVDIFARFPSTETGAFCTYRWQRVRREDISLTRRFADKWQDRNSVDKCVYLANFRRNVLSCSELVCRRNVQLRWQGKRDTRFCRTMLQNKSALYGKAYLLMIGRRMAGSCQGLQATACE